MTSGCSRKCNKENLLAIITHTHASCHQHRMLKWFLIWNTGLITLQKAHQKEKVPDSSVNFWMLTYEYKNKAATRLCEISTRENCSSTDLLASNYTTRSHVHYYWIQSRTVQLWYMCVQKSTLHTCDGNSYKIHGDTAEQVLEVLLTLSSDFFS